MSLRQNPPRTAKNTGVVKISSCLPVKRQPIKKCERNVTRPSINQELSPCLVNLVRLDTNKCCKQTGANHYKQMNTSNKPLSTKGQCFEENTNFQKGIDKTAPALNLRNRKPVQYAESSLEISKCEEKSNTQKVPVYKQQVKGEGLKKRKTDQYEFESDSEQYVTRKRRKLKNSGLEEYNLTLKKIINNISKPKKKCKKIIFLDKERTAGKQKKLAAFKKQEDKCDPTDIKQVTTPTLYLGKKNIITELNISTDDLQNKITGNIKGAKPTSQTQEKTRITKKKKYTEILNNMSTLLEKKDSNIKNQENLIDSDKYFRSAAEPVKSPRIKIISDVQLTPRGEWNVSIASPMLFQDNKPDANSTMLNNVLTPWRFNEMNIKRNPHFITLKQSSLPSINQEMVLDYTIVNKLDDSFKNHNENLFQETNKEQTKKTQIQSKIDDYMNSNIEEKENNKHQHSLFDSDQFSPIKRTNNSLVQSNNSSVRRKILSENNTDKNEQSQHSEQCLHLKSKPEDQKNIHHTNFGFDSLDDYSDKENSLPKEKVGPFRLSINVNDKKYDRKKKLNIHKVESLADSDEESDISERDDMQNDNGEIKLFEDFITTGELFEEERYLKKKKKNLNYGDQGIQRSKKRKNIRTREEDEEAEKWATAFNSMCEEIEKFPLEIE